MLDQKSHANAPVNPTMLAGCRAADGLLDDLAPCTIVLVEKAYESNPIRDLIER